MRPAARPPRGVKGRDCTLGAQTMCFPGTGSVVTYMVAQRYMYRVPIRKKQRRPTMDLEQTGGWCCRLVAGGQRCTRRARRAPGPGGPTYLCLRQSHWMSQRPQRISPLTSVTVKAHGTRST